MFLILLNNLYENADLTYPLVRIRSFCFDGFDATQSFLA